MRAQLRGKTFDVAIVGADGGPFAEHRVQAKASDYGNPPQTSCYLENEEGKDFALNIELLDGQDEEAGECDWNVKLHTDGRLVADWVFEAEDRDLKIDKVEHMMGGKLMASSLRFARLYDAFNDTLTTEATTDNQREVTLDRESVKKLGQIQVDFYAGKAGTLDATGAPHTVGKVKQGVIHEDDKYMASIVGFGDLQEVEEGEATFPFKAFDESTPTHQFIFQYRPSVVLQELGVVIPLAQQEAEDEDEIEVVEPTRAQAKGKSKAARTAGSAGAPPVTEGAGQDPLAARIEDMQKQLGTMQSQLLALQAEAKAGTVGPSETGQ